MTTVEVGDRVRCVRAPYGTSPALVGTVGTVIQVGLDTVWGSILVRLDTASQPLFTTRGVYGKPEEFEALVETHSAQLAKALGLG